MTRLNTFLIGFWVSVIAAYANPNHFTRSLNLAFMVVGMGWVGLDLYRSYKHIRGGRR